MSSIQLTQTIMQNFALKTGLSKRADGSNDNQVERYLWTDAYAVCNFLGLYEADPAPKLLQQALNLVEQVHYVLGQYRTDSMQSGWISGLSPEKALLHPTKGGLRIGKPFEERKSNADYNPSLEWQQDGQYFHYLTKWMHALSRVSSVTGDSKYTQWALELAKTAFSAFVYQISPSRKKMMYWKMSTDLTRPLVTSMGQHDPIDGYITYLQLKIGAKRFGNIPTELDIDSEMAEMASLCEGRSWVTEDSLGIGSLLCDAYKLLQLMSIEQLSETHRLELILRDIEHSLRMLFLHKPFELPAERRLAFRELGLAIGLQTIPRMQSLAANLPNDIHNIQAIVKHLSNISDYYLWHEFIENYWLKPEHQTIDAWQQHDNINSVMLATSLFPDGYLQL